MNSEYRQPLIANIYRLATSYGYEAWQHFGAWIRSPETARIAIANGIEASLTEKLLQAAEEIAAYHTNPPSSTIKNFILDKTQMS